MRSSVANSLIRKKPTLASGLLRVIGVWRCATLTWGNPTLPSALSGFTSEFGMDSGGTTSLLSPDKTGFNKLGILISSALTE